nr:cell wall protein DAN4 isoform X3 [Crassostrea gigas]
MKDLLCVLMAIAFLMTTNGQCPSNVGNISITTCSTVLKSGPRIYVDFNKITLPCECTVAFIETAGDLLVTAEILTIQSCNTKVVVNGSLIFGCPIPPGSSLSFNLSLYQTINVQAEYSTPSLTGTFYQCLGFQENGANRRNVGVTCYVPSTRSIGSYTASTTRKISSPSTSTKTASISTTTKTASTSPTTKTASTSPTTKITASLTSTKITSPSASTTTTTTIKRSTPLSSYTVQPTESISHFSNNINTDNSMSFVTTIAAPYSSSIESTQDDPKEMIYFIAGSAAGCVMLLIGLVVLFILKINRERNGNAIVENKKEDSARTNEVFDYNNELTENPLYVTSQPEEEVGKTSEEKHKVGLPVMDSKTKRKNNPDYDVPRNNKPIDSMSVYAVPNKNKTLHHVINTGDVYAQVKK